MLGMHAVSQCPHFSFWEKSYEMETMLTYIQVAGLEKELKLEGYDYNKLLSVFYIS